MGRVFLSGGTGFIAIHITDILLEHGHSVVTSVRSKEKGELILKNHPGIGKDWLDYVIVEDISDIEAFEHAIKSDPPFEYVLHTSSPFQTNVEQENIQKDLLDPAVNGTKGILAAIKKSAPSVKRVVITSSFAAIVDGSKGMWPGHIYSENDWNPTTLEQALTNGTWGYRASKTFAEKAAWEFLDREKPGFSLVTLNPPLVLGPIAPWLQTDIEHLNTSNQRFAALLTGKAKEQGNIPATGTPLFVDVRDLALAHVRALKIPEAGGKRFFITNGHFSNEEINDIIRDNFPEYADKLPSKGTKGGALPDGGYFSFDNTRSKEILKLEYTPLKSSVIDTVKSLQKIGA